MQRTVFLRGWLGVSFATILCLVGLMPAELPLPGVLRYLLPSSNWLAAGGVVLAGVTWRLLGGTPRPLVAGAALTGLVAGLAMLLLIALVADPVDGTHPSAQLRLLHAFASPVSYLLWLLVAAALASCAVGGFLGARMVQAVVRSGRTALKPRQNSL
jgi:hypothetical protein